jgi:hypothetical protein
VVNEVRVAVEPASNHCPGRAGWLAVRILDSRIRRSVADAAHELTVFSRELVCMETGGERRAIVAAYAVCSDIPEVIR